MATVACGVRNCRYNTSGLCSNTYTLLTPAGQCEVWYYRNGSPRNEPDYREIEDFSCEKDEPKQEDALEQEPASSENIEGQTENFAETENDEKAIENGGENNDNDVEDRKHEE